MKGTQKTCALQTLVRDHHKSNYFVVSKLELSKVGGGWWVGVGNSSPCFIVPPTAFILVLGTYQGIKKHLLIEGLIDSEGLEYICKYPLRILHPLGIKHLMFYSVLSQYANVQVP